jgi:hypothetical protein
MTLDIEGNAELIPLLISKKLFTILENRVKSSNGSFKSIEEYLTFILLEIVREEENHQLSEGEFTKEEDEEITNKLKKLGYI